MSLELKTVIEAGLKQLDEKLEASLKTHTGQVLESGEASRKATEEVKALSAQHSELSAEIKKLGDTMTAIQQKGIKQDHGDRPQSIGEQFVKSAAFKSYKDGQTSKVKAEFKNTILGEVGGEPSDILVPQQRLSGIIPGAFRQLRILDLMPRGTASSNSINYTRELLFTNNAAETAEGTQKPETVLTFEGVDTPVRTIAHFLKLSRQVMDDAPALQSYIDRRLRFGVEKRAELQIIAGNGTSPNLSGILDTGNYTPLAALSGENPLDFANRVKYKVVESDYNADVYLINPADWGKIERMKAETGSNAYAGSTGGVIGYLQNGLQPTLWGLPVIASNSIPAGTLIGMALDAVMFWNRQNTTVEIFDQNEDDVEKNLLTVRAEMRGAFSVFRPAAIVGGTLPA